MSPKYELPYIVPEFAPAPSPYSKLGETSFSPQPKCVPTCQPMALTPDYDAEVSMEIRDASPSDFLLKIENFSILLESAIEKHVSSEFESGGYKWRLVLYPIGRSNRNADGHISLYLALANPASLPGGFEINAVFNFFVYNHIKDTYLTARGRIQRFHAAKTEWGMSKFISHKILTEPSNGYLVDDICAFGVEVFVIKNKWIGQCLSMLKISETSTREWKIFRFSGIQEYWGSEDFTEGEHKWMIRLYPKGLGVEKNRSISVFLYSIDAEHFKSDKKVKAVYSVFIKNRKTGAEHHKSADQWFSTSIKAWGWANFLPLTELNAESGGFILDDCCIIKLELSVQCSVRGTLL